MMRIAEQLIICMANLRGQSDELRPDRAQHCSLAFRGLRRRHALRHTQVTGAGPGLSDHSHDAGGRMSIIDFEEHRQRRGVALSPYDANDALYLDLQRTAPNRRAC